MSKCGLKYVIAHTLLLSICLLSCVEYTPKPRGYFRIEPEPTTYKTLTFDDSPFQFNISQSVTVELPPAGDPAVWVNIVYPRLGATVYCDYLRISPRSLRMAEKESRRFVAGQLKKGESVQEKAYSNPESRVYGSLFLLDGGAASPVQFAVTDSVSNFFRGALYFDCTPNADSLAPAIQYIREDIVELIQSFSWK